MGSGDGVVCHNACSTLWTDKQCPRSNLHPHASRIHSLFQKSKRVAELGLELGGLPSFGDQRFH